MHAVHQNIIDFFAAEVSRDGGAELVQKLGAVAVRISEGQVKECENSLREAQESATGLSLGLFPVTATDAAESLAAAQGRDKALKDLLSDPGPGELQSRLARWFDFCFRWEAARDDTAAPWQSLYADHVHPGAKVVPITGQRGFADNALQAFQWELGRRRKDAIRLPVSEELSICLLPSNSGTSCRTSLLDEQGKVAAVEAVYVARAVRRDALRQGLGSAVCALDMMILPGGASRRLAFGYTEGGFPSRLAAVDLLHEIGAAIGEETVDPGPRPFVEDGVVCVPEPDLEISGPDF